MIAKFSVGKCWRTDDVGRVAMVSNLSHLTSTIRPKLSISRLNSSSSIDEIEVFCAITVRHTSADADRHFLSLKSKKNVWSGCELVSLDQKWTVQIFEHFKIQGRVSVCECIFFSFPVNLTPSIFRSLPGQMRKKTNMIKILPPFVIFYSDNPKVNFAIFDVSWQRLL